MSYTCAVVCVSDTVLPCVHSVLPLRTVAAQSVCPEGGAKCHVIPDGF